jgi:hypothetical protein
MALSALAAPRTLQVITKQHLDAAGQVRTQEVTRIREMQRPSRSGGQRQYAAGR